MKEGNSSMVAVNFGKEINSASKRGDSSCCQGATTGRIVGMLYIQ